MCVVCPINPFFFSITPELLHSSHPSSISRLSNPSKNFCSLQHLLCMVKCSSKDHLPRTRSALWHYCGCVLHCQINWIGHLPEDICAFSVTSCSLCDTCAACVVLLRLAYNNTPLSLPKLKKQFQAHSHPSSTLL